MKKGQLFSLLPELIGCAGIGAHLYLFDGISRPGPALTVFAAIFGAGMIGNLIFSLGSYFKQKKNKEDV